MPTQLPEYFDFLIQDFNSEGSSRFVHLGYWEDPKSLSDQITSASFAHAQARLNHKLLQMAHLDNDMEILDVGCGFGGTIETLDKSYEDMTFTGLNIDARQLALCKSITPSGQNTLDWILADACHLPLANHSQHIVYCIEAIFHFASRKDFFTETYRVLKPGGQLVFSDLVIHPSLHQLPAPLFAIEAVLSDAYGPWPNFWQSAQDIINDINTSQFQQPEVINITENVLPSHHFTIPSDADWEKDSGNPMIRSAQMLGWLQSRGYLNYLLMSCVKD